MIIMKNCICFSRFFLIVFLLLGHVSVYAAVDIVLNVNDSPDPVPAGGLLTYTINVANNGPDDATGVQLSSLLPPGVILQSVTPAQGSCSGTTTISCNLGNLDNNTSTLVTLQVIAPNTAGLIANTISSTSDQPDTNTTNNGKVEQTTVVQSSDLQTTKTDSADPVSQGQSYTYNLSVRNLGPFAHPATANVTVTDNIPASMRLSALPTGTNWVCSSSGGSTFPQNGPVTISCTRNTQANNALGINATFNTISVPVMALAYGTVTNEASTSSTMADKNTANNTALQDTTVNQAVDLGSSKTLTNTGGGTIATGTPLAVGQNYRYVISPSIIVGDTSGATLRVVDTLPANIQVSSAASISSSGSWTCNYSPAQTLPFIVSSGNPVSLVCDSASNYSNNSTTALKLADIRFDFSPTQGGTLTNSTTISVLNNTLTDINPANNTASITHTVNAGADLRITKSISGTGSVRALNSTATYTLGYRNAGTSDVPASGVVTIHDYLPSGVQVTSIAAPAGWVCPAASAGAPINGPATITCTRNGLTVSGAAANIVLSVKFTSTGLKQNITDISSPLADPNTSNNQATNEVEVVDTSTGGTFNDLSISKDDTVSGNSSYGPDPVAVTGTVRYRLQINNRGPSNMPAGRVVTVTDTIPPNASIVSVTPVSTGWVCTNTATVITCTKTVSSSNTWNINVLNTIDVILKAENGTSMTNRAQVVTANDPISSNDLDDEQTTILDDADLRIVKTVSSPTVYMGQNYVYTFNVTNLGSTPIPAGTQGAIRLVDDMNPDPGATRISDTSVANGWSCTLAGTGGTDPFICNYTNGLAVGASTSFSITVTPRTLGNARANTASIAFLPSAVVADPNSSNNSSTVNVDVQPSADMQVSKTASLGSVAAGQNITYILTARNNGPSTATNVSLIDNLPNNVAVVSVAATGGGICQQNVPAPGKIQCLWASMANGSTQSVTLVVRATKAAENTIITNQATISSDIQDLTAANNSSSVSTSITPAAVDIIVNKTDLVDPVAQNSIVVYQVSVHNLGPSVATNVLLTEHLPYTYLEFISADPDQGSCNTPDSNHEMLCSLGNIEAGQTALVTIRMLAKAIGTDINQVSINSDEQDANSGNNLANENTTVQLGADVQVSKSVDETFVLVNEPFWYTLNVINQGPANSNVNLIDVLPPGLQYQSYTSTRGSCSYNATNRNVTCGLGFMTVGQSATIKISVTANQLGTINNTATVTGTAPELAVENNESSIAVNSQLLVSGRVFNDNGGDTNNIPANAYNGSQESGESGIAGSRIQLTDCNSTVIANTITNTAGDYRFILNNPLPSPYCILQTNTATYSSVSGSNGYNRNTDSITVNNPSIANYQTGYFGDANLNVFLTEDGQHTITAGAVTDYPHQLVSQAPVQLSQLLQTLSQQPDATADLPWQAIVYNDLNCNGMVDAGEPVFNPSASSPQLLVPGVSVCLVQRVHAPINASSGSQQISKLQVAFQVSLNNPAETISNQSNQHQDTTLIGGSSMEMFKKVRVVSSCPSTPSDTSSFVISNQATSNSFLEYEITYRNNSTKNLVDIVIKDSVPLGTSFRSMECTENPTGSCSAQHNGDVMIWQTTGILAPAKQGRVRFCTKVL